MAKVGVIGAGSWGIALAKLLRTNGNEVTVWSIVEEEVAMLRREHEHIDKLPGVKLPEDVLFTTDLKEAIVGKEFLILAVPSVFTRWQDMCQKDRSLSAWQRELKKIP